MSFEPGSLLHKLDVEDRNDQIVNLLKGILFVLCEMKDLEMEQVLEAMRSDD